MNQTTEKVIQYIYLMTNPKTQIDFAFVKESIKKNKKALLNPTHIDRLIKKIKHSLKDKKIMTTFIDFMKVDVEEHMKKELFKETKFEEKKIIKNAVGLNNIFGYTNINELAKIINPTQYIRKAYIMLDRKYQNIKDSNNQKFNWQLAYHADNFDPNTTSLTRSELKNIIGIRMFQFRFPSTENALTFSRNLSVNIEEIPNQIFTALGTGKQYQFVFTLEQDGANTLDPYNTNDINESVSSISFKSPLYCLESITLTFGNPSKLLTLYPDEATATITSVGIQSVLIFSNPHYNQVGDRITISNFTTTNPITDEVEINLINDENGIEITAITINTITINVDLSTLTGVITNPSTVYFDNKRFVIHLELTYLI